METQGQTINRILENHKKVISCSGLLEEWGLIHGNDAMAVIRKLLESLEEAIPKLETYKHYYTSGYLDGFAEGRKQQPICVSSSSTATPPAAHIEEWYKPEADAFDACDMCDDTCDDEGNLG